MLEDHSYREREIVCRFTEWDGVEEIGAYKSKEIIIYRFSTNVSKNYTYVYTSIYLKIRIFTSVYML